VGERLQKLEDELFDLKEAIERLERVRGCEDVIEALEDKVKVLSVERDECHRRAEQEDDREIEALKRAYWAER